MSGLIFADRYRAAGLSPSPEIIAQREAAFNKTRMVVDGPKLVDLTRLFFQLPVTEKPEWFRAAFADGDQSFSLVDNAREAAVLSSCLLSAALEDQQPEAGLALLSASAGGNRKPTIYPELLREAKETLASEAMADRARLRSQIPDITLAKTGIAAAADQATTSQDWAKVAEVMKALEKSDAGLATQVGKVLSPLVEQLVALREEADMLWWYVGGWSQSLNRPLGELAPALIPVVAGVELASLVVTSNGPAAFSAILYKSIHNVSKKAPTKIKLQEAVDPISGDDFRKLPIGGALNTVPDVCPLLTAFLKASEIGESPDWHKAYAKASGLSATTSFGFLDIAVQAYRETLLLKLLS